MFRTVALFSLIACFCVPLAAQAVAPASSRSAQQDKRPKFGIRIAPGVLYLSEVEAGSLADKAGFEVGDVALRWNGKELDDFNALRQAVAKAKPGQVQSVVVRRGVMKNGDDPTRVIKLSFTGESRTLGLTILEGLSIQEIVGKNGVAERAGVRPGDFLVNFGKLEEVSFDKLRSALAALPLGQRVPLTILREGKSLDLVARFGPPRPGDREGPRGVPRPQDQPQDEFFSTWPRFLDDFKEKAGVWLEERSEIRQMVEDLAEAAEILRENTDNPRINRALKRIDRVQRKLEEIKSRVGGMRKQFERFVEPGADGSFELRSPLDPKSMHRLIELMEDGVDGKKIGEIMKKEFPDLLFDFIEGKLKGGDVGIEFHVEEDDESGELEEFEGTRKPAPGKPSRKRPASRPVR